MCEYQDRVPVYICVCPPKGENEVKQIDYRT